MKDTDKMSRAIGQIEKMARAINRDYFNNNLEMPIFTVQSSKGKSYGHSTKRKIWINEKKNKAQYEINIAAEFLNCDIECTLDTLIHEMIHLYCRQNNIQEVSRGGVYHNKKFKELAEKCGLKTFQCGNAGWNTTHEGNEKLTEYALKNDFFEINIGTNIPPQFDLDGIMGTMGIQPNVQGTRCSTLKYHCPKCGLKIRATKNIDNKLKCIDCDEIMIMS